MDIIRNQLDSFYDFVKPYVFKFTKDDPKRAHELFAVFCKALHSVPYLEELVLENKTNYKYPGLSISNAAGFNKDGQFHPDTLWLLGFDRSVIGTVTGDPWPGNPKPTILRVPETESMVNWEGLPGIGAKAVARRIESYKYFNSYLTVNFMSTPGKQGDELLRDLETTINATKHFENVDRYELNISCPNTHGKDGKMDMREENLKMLGLMLKTVTSNISSHQDIYLKVSPDSTEEDVTDTLDVIKEHMYSAGLIRSHHSIRGITTTNTTTRHNKKYVKNSPGKGGASGNAVYDESLKVQKLYRTGIKKRWMELKLIAAGGINSPEKIQERVNNGATEVQIYTPFVFSGPRLLRDLRSHKYFPEE